MTATEIVAQNIRDRNLAPYTIRGMVHEIGGGIDVTEEERIVRAALIEVYEEKTSEQAAEALMDEIDL